MNSQNGTASRRLLRTSLTILPQISRTVFTTGDTIVITVMSAKNCGFYHAVMNTVASGNFTSLKKLRKKIETDDF